MNRKTHEQKHKNIKQANYKKFLKIKKTNKHKNKGKKTKK